MFLHYKWPQCCTQSLIQCFHFFLPLIRRLLFWKLQIFFTVVFSPFDRSANELRAGRCFPGGSGAIRPAVWGNVCCWICCGKIEQGKKITISLIPSQFFPLSVSLFWLLGVRRCFPHSAAAANLPRSIVLLASFWTCAAINTVRCALSEAGLQEDVSVTTLCCHAAAHTLEGKQGESLEVLEPNSYCNKTTAYDDLWAKPTTDKVHALACIPMHATILSLPCSFQPQTNIASSSAESKQFWSLRLLIWKWSLSLISVSCWLGFWRFRRLSSPYLPGKSLSMCGHGKRVGMKCKWMPVWSCLENLARLQPRNPQSRLNTETLKTHSLSRSGLNGSLPYGHRRYLRGTPFPCLLSSVSSLEFMSYTLEEQRWET